MTENASIIKHKIKLEQPEENGPVMVTLDDRLYRCFIQETDEHLAAGVGVMRLNLVMNGFEASKK